MWMNVKRTRMCVCVWVCVLWQSADCIMVLHWCVLKRKWNVRFQVKTGIIEQYGNEGFHNRKGNTLLTFPLSFIHFFVFCSTSSSTVSSWVLQLFERNVGMCLCLCVCGWERKRICGHNSSYFSWIPCVVQKEFNSAIFWSVKKILQSQLFRLHPITHANKAFCYSAAIYISHTLLLLSHFLLLLGSFNNSHIFAWRMKLR